MGHALRAPRTSSKKPKKASRTTRLKGSNLRMVKDKGFELDVLWSENSMHQLQRKCYHMRMAFNWTQEELAAKTDLCLSTIVRYEDEERPMLAPRLKTFLKIFKAFGCKINVFHE